MCIQPLPKGNIFLFGSALAAAEAKPSSPVFLGKKKKAKMRKASFSFGRQQVSSFEEEKENSDGIL